MMHTTDWVHHKFDLAHTRLADHNARVCAAPGEVENPRELLAVQREIAVLSQVHNPYITAYYDSFLQGPQLSIVILIQVPKVRSRAF